MEIKTIFFAPCTSDEIITIVQQLKNSKAQGVDGLSISIIKQIITHISDPLISIFNTSMESGIFHQKLKLVKVTPIFKTEDKMLISNYRPISVLPVFSKILKKIIYSRVDMSINKHHILCQNQFGFREKHSVYMALLNIIDHI